MYVSGIDLLIQECDFINNEAKGGVSSDPVYGRGGALNLEWPFKDCEFQIKDSRFENNKALYNGGAINWRDSPTIVEVSTKFKNNTAPYGPDQACYA